MAESDVKRRRPSSDRERGQRGRSSQSTRSRSASPKKPHRRDSHSPSDSRSDSGDSRDDTVGHLDAKPGDRLGRYEVIEESGIGTFGKVFRCVDREGDGKEVAIKVVRNVKRYTESAEVEARILTLVNKADPANESHCVRFYSTFTHGEHMCMVFELLGPSVYDYLKRNRYKPLPLYCVQAFADQLCWAIAYLHALELTHTDLKPENLLLTPTQFVETSARTYTRQPRTVLAPKSTVMKLIDFGGATFEHQRKSSIIQTRQYRAPEVILNTGWDAASDMWSVGCILMEMYTGELLFQTHDNLEHLALIEKCLGPVPEAMTRSSEARKFYERGRLLHTRRGSRESLRHVEKMKPLRDIIHKDDSVFYDLVKRCLTVDPRRRIKAREAINHTFFTAIRGFRRPTEPAFRVSDKFQYRVDVDGVLAEAATASGRPASPRDDHS